MERYLALSLRLVEFLLVAVLFISMWDMLIGVALLFVFLLCLLGDPVLVMTCCVAFCMFLRFGLLGGVVALPFIKS